MGGISASARRGLLARPLEDRREIGMAGTRMPTSRDIARLVAFLPHLCADGFVPVPRWRGGTTQQDGTITMPWPEYATEVVEFFEAASKDCWCDSAYDPEQAARMLQDHDLVKAATLEQVRTMLTYCVRGERFCDGHWEAMIESGHIRRLLQRLAELRPPSRPRRYKCPHCGRTAALRIIYGYPSEETMQRAERGEILLGGCCRLIEDPDRACTACRYRWDAKTGKGAVAPD